MKEFAANTLKVIAFATALGMAFAPSLSRADEGSSSPSFIESMHRLAVDADARKQLADDAAQAAEGLYVSASFEKGRLGTVVDVANINVDGGVAQENQRLSTDGYSLALGWAPKGNGFGWELAHQRLSANKDVGEKVAKVTPPACMTCEAPVPVQPPGSITNKSVSFSSTSLSLTYAHLLTEDLKLVGKAGVALPNAALRFSVGGEYALKSISPALENVSLIGEYRFGQSISNSVDGEHGKPNTFSLGAKYTF